MGSVHLGHSFCHLLFEEKKTVEARIGKSLEVRSFAVSIGFRDPTFNQYHGLTTDPIQQRAIFRSIAAKTPQEAKQLALTTFKESPGYYQRKGKERTDLKVELEDSWVIAEAEGGTAVPEP